MYSKKRVVWAFRGGKWLQERGEDAVMPKKEADAYHAALCLREPSLFTVCIPPRMHPDELVDAVKNLPSLLRARLSGPGL